jgi:hypothetical protein
MQKVKVRKRIAEELRHMRRMRMLVGDNEAAINMNRAAVSSIRSIATKVKK